MFIHLCLYIIYKHIYRCWYIYICIHVFIYPAYQACLGTACIACSRIRTRNDPIRVPCSYCGPQWGSLLASHPCATGNRAAGGAAAGVQPQGCEDSQADAAGAPQGTEFDETEQINEWLESSFRGFYSKITLWCLKIAQARSGLLRRLQAPRFQPQRGWVVACGETEVQAAASERRAKREHLKTFEVLWPSREGRNLTNPIFGWMGGGVLSSTEVIRGDPIFGWMDGGILSTIEAIRRDARLFLQPYSLDSGGGLTHGA
jgi:hypothetical protein